MRLLPTVVVLVALSGCSAQAGAPTIERASVGAPAPAFSLADLDGDTVTLAEQQGKMVVIEWFNPQCPYVVYAHDEGPMGDLTEKWAEQGIVWLAINSNAEGTQGSDLAVNRDKAAEWGLPTVLLDRDGQVGRAYGAKNTPQMFIVDTKGTLVYNGALDNDPLGRQGGEYEPWLDQALTDVVNGAAVRRANNKPYGCSVKYGS